MPIEIPDQKPERKTVSFLALLRIDKTLTSGAF